MPIVGEVLPQIGEIRKDYEIGKGNKRSNCIWLACRDCNWCRWVRIGDTRKPNFTGLCHTCNLRRRNGKLDLSPNWKGGIKHVAGYVQIFLQPNHPFYSMTDRLGYVKRSRLVMAQHLGRPLASDEIVHHRNGVKDDDEIENLRLFPSNSKHVSGHRQAEILLEGNRPRDILGRFLGICYESN